MTTTTVLNNFHLVDVEAGEVRAQQSLVIDGKRIAWVGNGHDLRKDHGDAPRLDLGGKYVMPGMVQAHDHLTLRRTWGTFQDRSLLPDAAYLLRGIGNAAKALAEGITTFRDLGARGNQNIWLRDAINEGLVIGPRMFVAGKPIAMTGGHGYQLCIEADGEDNVRRAARLQVKAGADVIKVMATGGIISNALRSPQLTAREVAAAFEEARLAGKKTTAHAHNVAGIRHVLDAGGDCVEHAMLLTDDMADELAERGTYLVPTISESLCMAKFGAQLGRPTTLVDESMHHYEIHAESLAKAIQAGVRIAAGTDPVGDMFHELTAYCDCGMSTAEALRSATLRGAEVVGMEEHLGSIKSGKLADLVILNSNPLQDLAALDSGITAVMKEGVWFEAADLLRIAGPDDWKPRSARYHELESTGLQA